MNEALELEVGLRILEVGSGSGWHASTIAEIVAPSNRPIEEHGHVFSLEIIPSLVDLASKNIKRAGYEKSITIICKDGSNGYPEEAPFDRINVTAAAPSIPIPLRNQLKPGGIMVIPVGARGFYQTLIKLRKVNNEILEEDLGGVAFVPLIGEHGYKTH